MYRYGYGYQVGKIQEGALLNPNETEVDAYITGLTTPLSTTEIDLLNTLAASLKTGLGVTDLADFFDYFNIRAGETAEQSLRNFAKRAHDSTAVNSPTFTAGEGFTGNGTSSYIEVDYTPSLGTLFQLNDASYGLYFRVFNRGDIKYNGAYATDADGGFAHRTVIGSVSNTSLLLPINGQTSLVADTTTTNGLIIINRLSASSINWFLNKSKSANIANNSTKIPNQKMMELAVRIGNLSPAFFNTSQIAFSFCAKGLTDAHEAVIVDAFEAYMDAKGKGVIA